MNISLDWISDYTNIPTELSDEQIARRITLSVCEVEGWQRTAEIFKKVIVACVTDVKPHPNANKLKLAEVDLGDGKQVQVVCGAPNCRTGIKVPYAPVGITLPNGLTLEPKEIRGVLSSGMLCAEDELGVSENHEGLMVLSEEVQPGQTLADALGEEGKSDLVLQIDNKSLTHRPDCWGHYGLAREFAVVLDIPFNNIFDQKWAETIKKDILKEASGKAPVTLQVESDSANLGFLGLAVDNISVSTSPAWMKRRLKAAGMRPINTIVDISNYVMLETGIPNHIFDRSAIRGGKIIVRRSRKPMNFTTLDGQNRKLIESDTMVCDADHEHSIAGIMGGLEGSVTENTTQIMIEVANWKDDQIRRTSTRLGLRTDASQRYEKSLDSQNLETCLLRIYQLLKQIIPEVRCAGGIQSANMPKPTKLEIQTSPARIGNVLGIPVSAEQMTSILTTLGFTVKQLSHGHLTHRIQVPSYRATKDIECEADIVEEIGRIIGYNNITPQSHVHEIRPLRLSPEKTLFRKAQDFLVLRASALEIMTYPLVGIPLLQQAQWPVLNEKLVLANAIAPEHDRMRPSLIPSLLQATAKNFRQHKDFRMFECGRAYQQLDTPDFSKDLYHIGIVFHSQERNPIVELLDTVEDLLGWMELPSVLEEANPSDGHFMAPGGWAGSHPYEYVTIKIMGQPAGMVLSLHPQASRWFKLIGKTAIAVLDITETMQKLPNIRKSYKPLHRFPGADFDVTVVLPPRSHCSGILKAVKELKIPEIRSVGVLDMYNLGEQGQAVTIRIHIRDQEKTLAPEKLSKCESRIMEKLELSGYPLRQ